MQSRGLKPSIATSMAVCEGTDQDVWNSGNAMQLQNQHLVYDYEIHVTIYEFYELFLLRSLTCDAKPALRRRNPRRLCNMRIEELVIEGTAFLSQGRHGFSNLTRQTDASQLK